MPWQKKIFDCYKACESINMQIVFFHTLEKFQKKLHKHVLAPKESWGWEKLFPEIVKKYGNGGQISEDEAVLIYREMSSTVEKSLKFVWQFPLHIHLQRKEGNSGWLIRTVGITPEGFVIVCDGKSLITLYFRGIVSSYSGNFQCFWTARTHEVQKAFRSRFLEDGVQVEQKDQKVCTETTWNEALPSKKVFNSFYDDYQEINGGPLTQELDALLAKYRGCPK